VSLRVLYHNRNREGRENDLDKEPQTTDYYAAILADMEARRAALDTAIAGLRAAVAAGILGAFGELQTSPTALNATVAPAGLADLPRGAFLGKTAREAIRLYLSTIRRKQTNKEIAQALQEGGLESTGNFDKYITSALFRLKEDGELLRFDDGWGLSEWYNEAFRTKLGVSNTKKPAKRGKAKRKKPAKKEAASPAVRPVKPVVPEAKPAPTKSIDVRVVELLTFSAPNGIGPQDVAAALKDQVGVVNFSMARLAKKGVVRRGDDGKYYLTEEPE
jgi:hypothetical protein